MLNDLVMDAPGYTVEMHHSLKSPSQKWKVVPDTNLKTVTQYFCIVSERDGQVIDSEGNSLGRRLCVSPRSGKYTQLWRWDSSGSRLVNKLGLVAVIAMNRIEAGSSVIVWSPFDRLSQRGHQESGYIRSELNGLVLGNLNLRITMQVPSDKSTQKWKLILEEEYKNKHFYILNAEDGKALDATTDVEGKRIITSEFLRHSSQMWKWDSKGRLVSNAGLFVDIKEQSADAGAQVVLSSSTNASNEKWEEDGEYIMSKYYNLAMGTWKFTEPDSYSMSAISEITMQQPADRPSQKWKFL